MIGVMRIIGMRSPRIRNTIGVPTLYHCWAFGRMGKNNISKDDTEAFPIYGLSSKLLKGGYIRDYIWDFYRGY